jgi:hypothetical protein
VKDRWAHLSRSSSLTVRQNVRAGSLCGQIAATTQATASVHEACAVVKFMTVRTPGSYRDQQEG